MNESSCRHKYEKTGFCEWEVKRDRKFVPIKYDVYECDRCEEMKEVVINN